MTRNKLQELEGIKLMPHPTFSPDLAPSDYYLFQSLAHFLHLLTVQQPRGDRNLTKKSSLLQRKRTGNNVGSKNWQKGGFKQCYMMTCTLNDMPQQKLLEG